MNYFPDINLQKALEHFQKAEYESARDMLIRYHNTKPYKELQSLSSATDIETGLTIIVLADSTKNPSHVAESVCEKISENMEVLVVTSQKANASDENIVLEVPAWLTEADSFNAAAHVACGNYLLFLHDGDYIDSISLSILQERLVQSVSESQRIRVASVKDTPQQGILDNVALPSILNRYDRVLINADLFKSLGGFDSLLTFRKNEDLAFRIFQQTGETSCFYAQPVIVNQNYGIESENEAVRITKEREYLTIVSPDIFVYLLHMQNHLALHSLSFIEDTDVLSCQGIEYTPVGNIQELVSELARLKNVIRRLRTSVKYQLGTVLTTAYQKPLTNIVKLPLNIIKLLLKHRAKIAELGNNSGAGREQSVEHVNPNRTVLKYKHISHTEIFREKRNTGTRIGCLMDDYLFECLSFDAVCASIPKVDCLNWLDDFNPDLLLLTSSWDNLERADVGEQHPVVPEWMKALISEAKKRHVPSVFWHTDDAAHVNYSKPVAVLCEYVYASDIVSKCKLEKLLPDSSVDLLPPAIQPALHNPLKRDTGEAENLSCVFDGWCDILEYREQLETLLSDFKDEELKIVESSCQFVMNKLGDVPKLKSKIAGCVTKLEMISVYKSHCLSLHLNPTLASDITRTRRIMESIACGAIVLINDSQFDLLAASIDMDIEDAVLRTKDKTEMMAEVRNQVANIDERERRLHKARRNLYQKHTYAHRLQTILNKVNKSLSWEEYPLISIITAAKRPHFLSQCLDKYRAQTYPNKEWIIVVNDANADIEDFRQSISNYADIKLEVIHQENNIGVCLNTALKFASGKLWFKMDDDDYYGENYVLDMVLAWKTSGADVIGKPPAYLYAKKNNSLYIRKSAQNTNIIASKDHTLCGATISGTRKSIDLNSFSEELRACVDSHYVECAFGQNMRVHLTDKYNFIIYRSDIDGAHTWRPNEALINSNSTKVCDGIEQEQVMI